MTTRDANLSTFTNFQWKLKHIQPIFNAQNNVILNHNMMST